MTFFADTVHFVLNKMTSNRAANFSAGGLSGSQGNMGFRKPVYWSRKGRVAGILLAAILLGACASGVSPRKPDFSWPAAYDVEAQGMLPPASLDRWWLLYEDTQLDALVERAQQNGLNARAALARLREAQAVRDSALSRFNPQGDLQGSAEVRRTEDLDSSENDSLPPEFIGAAGSGRSRTANLSLPVSWELDLFGRRAAARRAADADLASARFDYEATRAAVVAEIARNLFVARGLLAQLEDARENAVIQRKLIDLLNLKVERGLTASSQADRVASDVALAEAQILALDSELKATRRAMLVLLGDGLESIGSLQISDELGNVPAVPATLPSDLLERRPDVRQAEARIRAAAGNVRLAELAFFPRLTLQPGVGLSAQRGTIDVTSGFWSLGLGLGVPILDRPRLSSALDIESSRGQQAVIAYELSVQTAFSETDQALTRLAADRERVQILSAGQIRAQRSYDAALKRYELGFADLQTLLDAERAWRAARTALTSAHIDALLRSVQTFQALGGGWAAAQTSLDTENE